MVVGFPDNRVIKVPKLNHKDYIMLIYKNTDIGWDYEKVFEQAIKDGWVRVIYERFPREYRNELSINGYDKDRVKYVLKNIFGDLIKYSNNTIFIDYDKPKESKRFSTASTETKFILNDFLNNN